MAQFFAHILPKPKAAIGEVIVRETHERTTCVQIGGSDLHDLLVHFVCERSGLEKKDIVSIELSRDVYGRTSLDQTLTAHFKVSLSQEKANG
jgi:hypothetical protein